MLLKRLFRKNNVEKIDKKISNHATLLWNYRINGLLADISISSDGSYIVAVSSDKNIYCLNREGELQWNYNLGKEARGVSLTQDGTHVVVWSEDYLIYFFNCEGELLWKYDIGNHIINVSISSNGSHIAVGSEHEVYLFNRMGKQIWTYKGNDTLENLSFSSDDSYIIVGFLDNNLYYFNVEGKLLWNYALNNSFRLSISSNKEHIITGSENGIDFFNHDGKLLWNHKINKSIHDVLLSKNGSYIVAWCWSRLKVYTFNQYGRLLWSHTIGGTIENTSISDDGSYIVVGSDDGKVYLFNLRGELLFSYELGGYVHHAAISSDGSSIIACSNDSSFSSNKHKSKIHFLKFETEFYESVAEKIKDEETALNEILENLVDIDLPDSIKYGSSIQVEIDIFNASDDSIELLTIDLSNLSEYFKLPNKYIKISKLESGMRLSKSVKMTPLFEGEFSCSFKIKSNIGTLSKEYPVKVFRTKNEELTTPTKATYVSDITSYSPTEIQAKFEDFLHWNGADFFKFTVPQWKNARENAYYELRRIFAPSNLEHLTKEDFQSFLYFENNKSWTALYRRGLTATDDMQKLRDTLMFLQDESIDIKTRVNEVLQKSGEYKIAGIGSNIATALLHVFKPDKYGVWNRRTYDGLKIIGLLPKNSSHRGEYYQRLNQVLTDLKTTLDTDLTTIDMFMYFITSPDKFEVRGISALSSYESDSESLPDISSTYTTEQSAKIEMKRGYEVLQNNDIRFGIRIINNTDYAILDVETLIDFNETLFSFTDKRFVTIGNIHPNGERTVSYVLKPLGCIHNEEVSATIFYKDHTGEKQIIQMRPKEVHCVCPFLKEMPMQEGEFVELASICKHIEEGLIFSGIDVDKIIDFINESCKYKLYRIGEHRINDTVILYFAGESIGDKAYYLLTAVTKPYDKATQVGLQAHSDNPHGLHSFLSEISNSIRHLAKSVKSAKEIGIIENKQVINIIDSLVQRTNFNFDHKNSSGQYVDIKNSIIQRTQYDLEDS